MLSNSVLCQSAAGLSCVLLLLNLIVFIDHTETEASLLALAKSIYYKWTTNVIKPSNTIQTVYTRKSAALNFSWPKISTAGALSKIKKTRIAFNRKSAALTLSTKINKRRGALSKNTVFYKCFSSGKRALAFFFALISHFFTICFARIFID